MKAVLEKLSAYSIFGYLLPGSLFVILGERLTSFSLIQRSWIVGIVLYYFIGLVISRVGTLIVKPVLERIGLVRETSYDDYVEASESDSRIDILSAQNNLFRTLCAMVMMLIGLKIGEKVIGVLPWGAAVYDFIVLVALFILFVFSYRKKTQELVRRAKHVQQKGQK